MNLASKLYARAMLIALGSDTGHVFGLRTYTDAWARCQNCGADADDVTKKLKETGYDWCPKAPSPEPLNYVI